MVASSASQAFQELLVIGLAVWNLVRHRLRPRPDSDEERGEQRVKTLWLTDPETLGFFVILSWVIGFALALFFR